MMPSNTSLPFILHPHTLQGALDELSSSECHRTESRPVFCCRTPALPEGLT